MTLLVVFPDNSWVTSAWSLYCLPRRRGVLVLVGPPEMVGPRPLAYSAYWEIRPWRDGWMDERLLVSVIEEKDEDYHPFKKRRKHLFPGVLSVKSRTILRLRLALTLHHAWYNKVYWTVQKGLCITHQIIILRLVLGLSGMQALIFYYRCNNYVARKVSFCVFAWAWHHWHLHLKCLIT